jgi:DNA polymerase-3 subunit delta'
MSDVFPTLRTIIGHEKQIRLLTRALASGRIGGAYVFAGASRLGKKTVAAAFAAALNCEAGGDDACGSCGSCGSCRRVADRNHPDVVFVQPDGATLRIAQIRELQRQISLRPHEGRYKVFVVTDAETMRPEAANALLKTLEEPPGAGVLVLTTSSVDALLPTIRSRSQELRFLPVTVEDAVAGLATRGVDPERAKMLAVRSRGRVGVALRALGEDVAEEEDVPAPIADSSTVAAFRLADEWQQDPTRLDDLLSWYHDLLLLSVDEGAAVEHVDHARTLRFLARRETYASLRAKMRAVMDTSYRLRRNVSAPLALESLALQLAQTPLTSPWGRASLL